VRITVEFGVNKVGVPAVQYLLSREEYKSLVDAKHILAAEMKDTLQKLCTMVADHMPLEEPNWQGVKRPWGCILSTKVEHYCDECPVEEICPCLCKQFSQ
jgi:hypothetical protein